MTKKPLRILFVCTGNTCRSPTAEWMTRWMLENKLVQEWVHVASAGLSAHSGAPLSEHTKRLLQERLGREVEHVARQLTADMVQDADWVVTMTDEQRQTVRALAGDDDEHIILLWECGDIPDPHGGTRLDYQKMVETVEEAVTALIGKIQNEG